MNYLDIDDTIVALATARGLGSVDVVRLSGKNLVGLFKKITNQTKKPVPNQIKPFGLFSPINKKLIDRGLVSFFKSPRSFTGEDVIEINCHGGGFVSSNIIKELCSNNLSRQALPGEFLFRAYINNKIDLIQAEAINDLILSESTIFNSKSLENVGGEVSKRILNIKNNLINLLTIIEHELDFDEFEVSHIKASEFALKIQNIQKQATELASSYFFSKIIRNGLKIIILGKPNVGKSSIYNYLLGINRSIVSSQAGTTRDTVESFLEICGYPVVLVDTAGYWESSDPVELLGIEKTSLEIKESNIILLVGEEKDDFLPFKKLLRGKNIIKILSKSDIKKHSGRQLSVSSLNGLGFDNLLTQISTNISSCLGRECFSDRFLINKRQYEIINGFVSLLDKILNLINNNASRDVLADFLHELLNQLNDLISPIEKDEIINKIFSNFCVGK